MIDSIHLQMPWYIISAIPFSIFTNLCLAFHIGISILRRFGYINFNENSKISKQGIMGFGVLTLVLASTIQTSIFHRYFSYDLTSQISTGIFNLAEARIFKQNVVSAYKVQFTLSGLQFVMLCIAAPLVKITMNNWPVNIKADGG